VQCFKSPRATKRANWIHALVSTEWYIFYVLLCLLCILLMHIINIRLLFSVVRITFAQILYLALPTCRARSPFLYPTKKRIRGNDFATWMQNTLNNCTLYPNERSFFNSADCSRKMQLRASRFIALSQFSEKERVFLLVTLISLILPGDILESRPHYTWICIAIEMMQKIHFRTFSRISNLFNVE